MIDTVRIIISLDCNLSCSYCCNEIPEVRNRFARKALDEINFSGYQNVVITGGEPFYRKDVLFRVLRRIPPEKTIYMNTNGMLITDNDIELLRQYSIKGITIGLHAIMQPKQLNPRLEMFFPVRYNVDIEYRDWFLKLWPGILTEENLRGYELNKCDMPNEDWILLDEDHH